MKKNFFLTYNEKTLILQMHKTLKKLVASPLLSVDLDSVKQMIANIILRFEVENYHAWSCA